MAKKPAQDAAAQGDAGGKSGGGLAGILMVAGASLAASFGLFYFLSPSAPPALAAGACPQVAAAPALPALATADQVYVELKEVLITVGSEPATRYLKMNISVVTGKDGVARVKAAEPMLIDAFNNYLRSIELRDVEDPSFYPHMREQLARRAELVLGSTVSSGVLITEFLLR